MNWCDFAVIAVIVCFALVGLKRGLILSVFKLVSFIIAIVIAIKFYPLMADFLMKTSLYSTIETGISKNLPLERYKETTVGDYVKDLPMPGFFTQSVVNQFSDKAQLIDESKIADMISKQLATIVISIISVILLYLIARIVLLIIRMIFQSIAELPVLKQANKAGGFFFGLVEGLLTVYIAFALLILFHALPQFNGIIASVNDSVIANFFFQHNYIVDFVISKTSQIHI